LLVEKQLLKLLILYQEGVLSCQVITIDPSKQCHAVKQLVDKASDCEQHVEELTWKLDDTSSHPSSNSQSQISDTVRSKKEVTKSPLSSRTKLHNDSYRITEVENKEKRSPPKSKSHIFDDSRLQQRQKETKSLSSSSNEKLKVGSSPNKIAKLEKQKNTRNNLASFSESDVDKLSSDKKRLKLAGGRDKSISHYDNKLDCSKPDVRLNGDQHHWKEIGGVVSFTDEPEVNDLFSSHQQTSILQQGATYSEFQSAVLDEYVDREPARNVAGFSSRRRTDHDSSDEDVFDLIASGRISKIMPQSQGSRSNHNSLPVALRHRPDLSAASDVVDHDLIVTERQTPDREVDGYDSASSADTDVIIRSQRVMSNVTANVQSQTVGSVQPHPNTELNITGQHCSDGSRDQPLSIGDDVSSSRSWPENRCDTELKRKKKRLTGECSDNVQVVQNSATANVYSPAVQEPASTVDKNIVPRSLSENCHSGECKRKRKSSKVDDSEVTMKNGAINTDISTDINTNINTDISTNINTNISTNIPPIEAVKSDVLPNAADVYNSSSKRNKTDVSVLVVQ